MITDKGIILSTSSPKSTIWCPNLPDQVGDPSQRGLKRVVGEGVVLLGAPLGSPEFIASEVKKKVAKIEDITELLPQMEDPHTEYVLLKSCLSLPKLSFLHRTVNTCQYVEHLQTFDRVNREALTRILGTPLDDQSWQQAKLPISMGGVGLRAAEDQAPAAYAASLLSSQTLVESLVGGPDVEGGVDQGEGDDLQGSLSPQLLAALSTAQGAEVVEAELVGLTQRMISFKIDQHQQQRLKEMVGEEDTREKARLASLSLPHAGDWLNCAPIKSLGLHLRPPEFVLAVKNRLGLPIYDAEGPCPVGCFTKTLFQKKK